VIDISHISRYHIRSLNCLCQLLWSQYLNNRSDQKVSSQSIYQAETGREKPKARSILPTVESRHYPLPLYKGFWSLFLSSTSLSRVAEKLLSTAPHKCFILIEQQKCRTNNYDQKKASKGQSMVHSGTYQCLLSSIFLISFNEVKRLSSTTLAHACAMHKWRKLAITLLPPFWSFQPAAYYTEPQNRRHKYFYIKKTSSHHARLL
jgi:hypothetical protein